MTRCAERTRRSFSFTGNTRLHVAGIIRAMPETRPPRVTRLFRAIGAPEPGGGLPRHGENPRRDLARRALSLALFGLPACAIATPWGLAPGAVAMLAATVLGFDQLLDVWRSARRWVRPLVWTAMLVLAVTVGSMLWAGTGWDAVDNHARVLVMPLLALLVIALRPSRTSLWAGAVVGLAGACVVALIDSYGGLVRARGWSNAIVFANVVVGLLAVAVFCRPPGRKSWVALAVTTGVTAALLTGVRGVWPALVVLGVIALVVNRKHMQRLRARTWVLLGCLLALLALLTVPLIVKRADALRTAVVHFDGGVHDSSYGARRDLLRVSLEALRAHPLTGVGIGNFKAYLTGRPMCARSDARACRFDHAHSEFPQWAATMGLPGLLVALLLYGMPLALLRRLLRDTHRPATSAAAAGIVFVVGFVIGGLTQSMFAHQLTASLFAILAGALIGFGVLEREADARAATRADPV